MISVQSPFKGDSRNERFMVVMKSSLSPLIISSESNVRKSKVLKLN